MAIWVNTGTLDIRQSLNALTVEGASFEIPLFATALLIFAGFAVLWVRVYPHASWPILAGGVVFGIALGSRIREIDGIPYLEYILPGLALHGTPLPPSGRGRGAGAASAEGSGSAVDLASVRFFLGYGLIFLVQSAITIVIGSRATLRPFPPPAALRAVATPSATVSRPAITSRMRSRCGPIFGRSQMSVTYISPIHVRNSLDI